MNTLLCVSLKYFPFKKKRFISFWEKSPGVGLPRSKDMKTSLAKFLFGKVTPVYIATSRMRFKVSLMGRPLNFLLKCASGALSC